MHLSGFSVIGQLTIRDWGITVSVRSLNEAKTVNVLPFVDYSKSILHINIQFLPYREHYAPNV
jgi:hypothetical protein